MTTTSPTITSAVPVPKISRTQAFIGGSFVDAIDGATFQASSPATGKPLARVSSCGVADVDLAVKAARDAFESGAWSRIAPAQRKRTLLRLADLIEANRDELAAIESADAGKPITECREVDLPDVVNTFRWYAEAVDKVFGKISPTGEEHLALIVREPIGVVAGVLPWNFPASMLAWKVAPALAAGNSVVIKPPELASLTTLRIAELASEAGVPAGVFNVVPGRGSVAGKALGLHNDVDAVTFTGSTEVGRQFLRYAADSNLKEAVLECGGKNPSVVMADCGDDLELIAEDLAEAAFWNTGQNCSAGSRILVHSSIKDEFVSHLVSCAERRVVGDPADPATQLGPLIEAAAMERVLRAIDEARADGATILTGGKRLFEETGGWFVGPTVIDNVRPEMAVARDEIFGPVTCVLSFEDEEEALRMANDTDYGLAATVWSKDLNVALRMARGIRAGTVAINGFSEGDITTPFGGHRSSGFGGRDNGLEAIEQYTELKTIWMTMR